MSIYVERVNRALETLKASVKEMFWSTNMDQRKPIPPNQESVELEVEQKIFEAMDYQVKALHLELLARIADELHQISNKLDRIGRK